MALSCNEELRCCKREVSIKYKLKRRTKYLLYLIVIQGQYFQVFHSAYSFRNTIKGVITYINAGKGWPAAGLVWELLQAVSSLSSLISVEFFKPGGSLCRRLWDRSSTASFWQCCSVGGMEGKLLKANSGLTRFVKSLPLLGWHWSYFVL